ncbi:MAG: CPBP family intramembrane metalloprotease [Chlamydiia bacterium]|nr:CPBP family intramembrane metalloprotease [Chlamydiia bacterium]
MHALKLFLSHPLYTSTYSALILAILSFWIYRRTFIWASLIIASIGLALIAKIISPPALIPIAFLAACHFCLRSQIQGFLRAILISVAGILSLGLMLHLFPGFNNWLIVKSMQISPDGIPYTLYFNYDKPFIGIFILAAGLPLLSTLKQNFAAICLWSGITIITMLVLSRFFSIVHFDPKLPSITVPWIIANFFLVCIPEEVFWRGFLQREITNSLQSKTKWAPYIAIGILSAIFALMHLAFVFQVRYIILAFCASVLYGLTYHYTKSVEGAIAAHFLLNATQFFFFTYPALA